MLNLIISFAEPFTATVIGLYFICKLLPNRLNIYGIIAIACVFAAWFIVRDHGGYVLYGTRFHLWMNIFINAWTFFVFIYFFKGVLWRRLIIYWYFEIIHVMCQTLAFLPIFLFYSSSSYSNTWSEMMELTYISTVLQLAYTSAVILLYLLMGFLSLKIWQKLSLQKFQVFYLLFIAIPIGQLYSLTNVIHPSMGDVFFGIAFFFVGDVELSYRMLSIFGASISLVAFIVLFYYILSHDKRAAIEAELTETHRVIELEQAHYFELEQKSEEMAKIRHDFNNQLAIISRLIRSGEDSSARDMISTLSKEIANTKDES